MAAFTELLQIVINADSKGAVAGLGAVGKEAGLTNTNVGLLGQSWDKFKKAMGTTAGQVTAIAAGVLLLGKVMFDASKAFADATAPVRAFQRVAGTTAEDSSRLVFAMQRLGIDAEQGGKAFFKLGNEVETNKAKFDGYGIAIAHNRRGHVDLAATFANVSDAYRNMSDQGEKNTLVADLFGKRMGASVIPLLQQGREELAGFYKIAEQDHRVFSDADFEKGKQFNRAMFDLDAAMTGVEIELGQAVIPAVIGFTHALTGAIHALDEIAQFDASTFGRIGDAVEASGSALDKIREKAGPLGDVYSTAVEEFGGAFVRSIPVVGEAVSVLGLFGGAEESAAEKAKKLADKLDEQARKAKEATDAVWAKIGADLSLQGSVLGVGDALSAQAKAAQDAADKSGLDADANRKVEESHIRVSQAISSVAAAAQAKAETDNVGASNAVIAAAGAQAQYDSLVALEQKYPELKTEIDGYIAQLLAIPANRHTVITMETQQVYDSLNSLWEYLSTFSLPPNIANALNVITHPFGGAPPPAPKKHRASGGPVVAGELYHINEFGGPAEMFRPNVNGTVIPISGSGGGGGGSMSVTIQAGTIVHERDLENLIVDAVMRAGRNGGLAGARLVGVTAG